MDPTNKEILRLLQELIDITDRKLAARYDRMIQVMDSCLTTGGTTPSSSTSAGSDVCSVAEVPTPASPNPITGVPAPASSDSDAKLVTIDVGGPAAPAWTTHSTGEPSRDTTESRSAPAPTTAPTEHMITVDIVPVLAAPAATDGTLHGQAVSDVPSTPATCSIVCLPRNPVAAAVLVASSTPAPLECILNTNTNLVEAVSLATMGDFPAVLMPTAFPPMIQMQQLYNGINIFIPTSGQFIASKVPRPMPWPSFMGVHVDGDDTRPLPWPSFMEDYGCEALNKTIVKPSQWRSSDSSRAESCATFEFQISELCGNLLSFTGYIITHDLCNPSERRCLGDVPLIVEYWESASDSMMSATNHTTLVWLSCIISGFLLRVIVGSLELKLLSVGHTPEAFVNCAIHDASYWPGNFVIVIQMQVPEQDVYPSIDLLLVQGLFFLAAPTISACILVLSLSNMFAALEFQILEFHCGNMAALSNEPDRHWCSSEVKESVVLNLPRNCSNYVLCDQLLLPLGNSGHKTNVSSYQLCCAYRSTSSLSGNRITGGQLQVTASCSAIRLLLSVFPPCFCLVVLPELKLARTGSQSVYLQKLKMDTSEPEGAALYSISINGNCCQLKWCEASLACSVGMVMYCSSFSCTREGTSYKSILAPAICSVAWTNLICFSNSKQCALLVSSGYNTPLTKSVISGLEQLTIEGILLGLQDGHVDITRCNTTIWSRYMILVRLGVATHLAIRSNYPTDRQLDLGTKTTCYSNFKYSMMVVNNCAMPIHVKDFRSAYVSAQMEWDNIVPVLSCELIQLGKLCPNWRFVHSAIGRPAFLIPSQPVALKNMELWWFTNALLTEITSMFSTVFSRQLVVTCSVQSNLLLAHAYQHSNFGWEQWIQIAHTFASGNLKYLPSTETVMYALVAANSEVMFMVAFGGGQETFQGGRHMQATDQNKELRFPWDPGVAAAAWGQAAFQGGRGVRDPSYLSSWAGSWAVVVGLTTHQQPVTMDRTTNMQGTATQTASSWITTDGSLSIPFFSLPCPQLLLPSSDSIRTLYLESRV